MNPRIAHDERSGQPTRAQLMRLAYHYQDLARRHQDEERFWLSRASYFGRRSRNP
jgi:hypothetical protein